MVRLAPVLYSLIGSRLAGAGAIAVPVAGPVSTQAILVSAAIGALADAPVAWLVAGQLYARGAWAFRNTRAAASNSRGFSACSQWPAPGSFAKRAAGKRARILSRCSGST